MDNPYEAPQSEVADATQDLCGEIKVFSFKGRIGRIRYIGYSIGLAMLIQMIMSMLMGLIFSWFPPSQGTLTTIILPALITIPMLIISIMLTMQRLHDLNWTGWLSLLMFIPGINFIFGLVLTFMPGNDSENRFGLKPPPNTMGTYVVALVIPILIIGILAAIAIPAYNDFKQRAESQSLNQQQ